MTDEGMGRPEEAYERYHDPAPTEAYAVPVPYGYRADELNFSTNVPLNMRDVVVSRMRGMDEAGLSRFITAACVMYWESSENVSILECLYKASELERETRP